MKPSTNIREFNDKLSLQVIAEWQLRPEQSEVELPTIQRGFVWKTRQIENLWDSLLREYPIGSFLLSKTSTGKYHLMDGQQRATSIFLGFQNPFSVDSTAKAWAIKGGLFELPVVWIDICPKESMSTRKYLLRVTTRSHPWGYQAGSQDTRLTVSDRRKALELFRKDPANTGGYTSFKNTSVFPYDASCPLPLCFFLEAQSIAQVINMAEIYLPDYIHTKHGDFANKAEYIALLRSDEFKEKVGNILNASAKTKARSINFDIVTNEVLNEEQKSDDPTLFVRINSAGTPLSGDDLIYSIYKATFPNAKNLVENIGMDFIAPTQVVSLASRIAMAEIENNRYPGKMNVRQFQQRLKVPGFREKLETLISNGKAGELFKQALEILQCKDNPLFKGPVPPVLVKQFVNKSPDLFLFLVHWLNVNQPDSLNEKPELKLKMTAKLLCFSWFQFDNIPRLWKEEINNKSFWDVPLNQHIWWDGQDGIHFLISPALIREYYMQDSVENMFITNHQYRWGLLEDGTGQKIKAYYNTVKSSDFERQTANEYFWKFIQIIQHRRQFVLFAQRDYINNTFGDYNQMDNLDDTNTPWDWDHIYPSEWVYRKVYCNQAIKDWNGTNGNYRAISLEQNRHESNHISPSLRLSDETIREYSFVKNDWTYWQNIHDRIYNDAVQNHFRAITQRMVNIYETFWNDLKIGEMIEM